MPATLTGTMTSWILSSVLTMQSTKRSIKMSPKDASQKKNETKVYRNLYGDLSAFEPQPPKFKVGDNSRIRKKKSMFEKGYTPRWTEEIFKINEVQMTRSVTYKLEDLNEERIEGSFYEAGLQKTDKEMFRIEKVLRRDN